MPVLLAVLCVSVAQPSVAETRPYAASAASLDEGTMVGILNHPDTADHAAYGATDSAGNPMQSPSIVQLSGVAYKYAAVYHTPYAVSGGYRYRVNLAASTDLVTWHFVRTLLDDADMPKIERVAGSSWIVLTHEQWLGAGPASTSPSQVTFRLFYDDQHLLDGSVGSTYAMPMYGTSDLNGTPSFYDAHMSYNGGYYRVDGQYGFHSWNGSRDVNDVTTIYGMFDPRGDQTRAYPSTADAYNNKFIAAGVTGNIGQRDTIDQGFGRYNVQEGNVGTPAGSWDKWRLSLYEYSETTNYPTGEGTVTRLAPVTPHGSVSFGNPSVRVVDAPDGNGQVMWVSYFLFSEGAGPGEAGSLIYWTHL